MAVSSTFLVALSCVGIRELTCHDCVLQNRDKLALARSIRKFIMVAAVLDTVVRVNMD